VIIGPHALGWIHTTQQVDLLAEIGVVFLMFSIGLEFSLSRLVTMRRIVFGLGGAQVAATMAVVLGLALLSGTTWQAGIVLGGALAMSSTAILAKLLVERLELNSPHGRQIIGILLFQDLAVVPLLILIPAFAAPPGALALNLGFALLKAVVVLAVLLFVGQRLMRGWFHIVASQKSSELFVLNVLLVVLGVGFVTELAGLSLALGAFVAGVLISETEYRYQVEEDIRPFRELLLGLFFVTIGMQLDVPGLFRQLPAVAGLFAGLIVLKALIVMLVARPSAGGWFKSLRTGIVLAQGGEFGFALLVLLLQNRLIGADVTQPLLAANTLSMVVSPLLIQHNKRIARFILRESAPAPTGLARFDEATRALAGREHVMLCGYGRVGQNIARVLEGEGFEFLAIDLDPKRVRAARAAGDPVLYGDAADEGVLESAGLNRALAVVVTYSDAIRSLATVRAARRLHTDLPILVRAIDDSNLDALLEAGATEVVPETLEAALTLVGNTLHMLDVSPSRVIRRLGDIRRERYKALRSVYGRDPAGSVEETGRFREELHMVLLPPGAWVIGKTIREVRERGAEVSFTAVRRDDIIGREPDLDMKLREGDVVVLFGTPEAQEHAESVLLTG
jgi:CPA2 family monovalent cation:H+ antiporter-2